MKHSYRLVVAFLSAALLAACGGGNNGLSSSMPAAPQHLESSPARQPLADSGFKHLYSFKGGSGDGASPEAALISVNGTLYGTTSAGGKYDRGTVFAITTSGKETVLHSFGTGVGDGIYPLAALLDVKGTLYGTTSSGGNTRYGDGTVFSITTSGKERVVCSFKGEDGARPEASTLVALNGTLYGTTRGGGRFRSGAVFAVNPSTGKEHVVYNFKGSPDGDGPWAGVTVVNGELDGTTRGGGSGGFGTIFGVSTSGKEEMLYSFEGGIDGGNPYAGLLALNGALYGTAVDAYDEAGSVFEVSTSGSFQLLYDFKGHPDGASPEASLIAINNELYGTTYFGGSNSYKCLGGTYADGCGTVFEVSTSGKEQVLYTFKDETDGGYPQASLLAVNGVLYGTTEYGGGTSFSSDAGAGTVFEVTP